MSRSMLHELPEIKERVRHILEEYPDSRNDDRLLCVLYWRLVDGAEDLDDVLIATLPEGIRRSRQKLNEAGILLATDPDVLRRRRQLEVAVRQGIVHI